MKKRKKHFIISYNIDSYVSAIVLKWMYSDMDLHRCKLISKNNFIDKIDSYLFEHVEQTDIIYFLGFEKSFAEDFRKEFPQYTDNKFLFLEDINTSLAKSIHSAFENTNRERQTLIDACENWVTQKYDKNSYYLSILWRLLNKNKFFDLFEGGFSIIPSVYVNMIKNHIMKYKNIEKVYYELEHKDYKFHCLQCSIDYLDDACFECFKNNKCDVLFLVDTSKNKVFIRRKKECNVDLSKYAKTLCNGDGFPYAASGDITNLFLDFTKKFNKVNS